MARQRFLHPSVVNWIEQGGILCRVCAKSDESEIREPLHIAQMSPVIDRLGCAMSGYSQALFRVGERKSNGKDSLQVSGLLESVICWRSLYVKPWRGPLSSLWFVFANECRVKTELAGWPE